MLGSSLDPRNSASAVFEFTELNRRRVFGNPGLSIDEVERWQELREALSRVYPDEDQPDRFGSADRRSDVRHATHLRVVVNAAEQGIAMDISLGGIFIATPRPLPIGSEISLEIETPLLDKPIRVAGSVVRVEDAGELNRRPGMGIMFSELDAEQCGAIKVLVSRLEHAD